ncbi:MAG: M20/M25/M40 family metallo-hydrolase [Acidobacteriota bacterium]
MINRFYIAFIRLLLLTFAFISFSIALAAQQTPAGFSSEEQIKADLQSVPCKNEDRLGAVKSLFEKMGASPSEISIDKFKNVENLVIIKPGSSAEKIIIGAHYDKVSAGCGALDNWTGIVALAHIYKTLKPVSLNKTLVFVAFGKEESGLIGSTAMAGRINKEQVSEYCAMVNIDSLGLGAPQVADNMSSKKLLDATASLAKSMNMPFGHAIIAGADSDSSSFKAKKIPALTIHGLTNEWPQLLHSHNDRPSKINSTSVYLGYGLALALIYSIDKAACDAYR